MQVIKENKVTFKTEDVLIELMSQFFKMRASLYKLINETPDSCFQAKQIFTIAKSLPKSLQRSKNRYNELVLCQQLSQMLHYFTTNTRKQLSLRKNGLRESTSKHKPYELFLLFRQVTEIIINRIKSSVTGNIQQIANNKENFKLFYFINELQRLNIEIQRWAKNRDRNLMKGQHQSVELIYPESATYRKTLATTTDASKNLSKHEKHSTFDEFNQKSTDACGLRAHTAKLKKRDVKLTTRCPSAAAILKNQTYKQPLFEPKKGILKVKHKSTDFENKTCRNNFQSPENNFNFESNINSRSKETKVNFSKQRKISILNKTILKQEDDGLKVKSSKKILNENQRLKKTGIMMLGKRRKQMNQNVLSNEQISSNKDNPDSQKIQSQCRILDPEVFCEKKPPNVSFKQIKAESCSNVQSESSESKSSLESSFWQTDENTVYIKQRQLYKKARRSGKVLIKDKEDFKDVYMINIPKAKEAANFTRRRKAMLSTHNEDMTEIQKIINSENQQKAQKQLEYDENVLLALSDALRSKKNIKQPKEINKVPKRKHTFNSLFNEMNAFLKDYYIGRPNEQFQSVFFEQQKRIRCFEDYNFRQRMKELIKKNASSNVFDIPTAEVNNKDQIYNQIHRYFTFNSDSEWIKNMFTPKQTLIQKQM